MRSRQSALIGLLALLGGIAAAATAGGEASAAVASGSTSTSGGPHQQQQQQQQQPHHQRQLLQNQQYLWPREMASIAAANDLVMSLVNARNSAADGIRAGARGAELVRLASNKAVQPSDFDRPAAPTPARPSRNPVGRRRLAGFPQPPRNVPLDAIAEALAENML